MATCLVLTVLASTASLLRFYQDDAPDKEGKAVGSARLLSMQRRQRKDPLQTVEGAVAKPMPGVQISMAPHEQYKSQDGQDKWANEQVFFGKTHGVFVDLGCYDGVTYSNTWYFERVLNWTGVCVEPNPEVFPRIEHQAGRSTGVQLAVSDHKGSAPFVAAYMRSSLNASAVDYGFLASQGVKANEVRVELTTPSALLSHHLPHATVIDYVNIDVEQLELSILRAWPFERYCVMTFNIENEPAAGSPSILPELKAILEPRGYGHRIRIGVDEVFVRRQRCPGEGDRALQQDGSALPAARGSVRNSPKLKRSLRRLRHKVDR